MPPVRFDAFDADTLTTRQTEQINSDQRRNRELQYDKYLRSWRVAGCAEEWRDGIEAPAGELYVNRRSDEKLTLRIAARTFFGLVLEQHFNANIKCAVDHNIGKRLADGNLSFAPANERKLPLKKSNQPAAAVLACDKV